MQLKWLTGCKTAEQKEKRKDLVLGAQSVLDILKEICYNSILEEQSVSKKDYDSPSWSHLQAHKNGRIEALNEIIKMCDLKGDH